MRKMERASADHRKSDVPKPAASQIGAKPQLKRSARASAVRGCACPFRRVKSPGAPSDLQLVLVAIVITQPLTPHIVDDKGYNISLLSILLLCMLYACIDL